MRGVNAYGDLEVHYLVRERGDGVVEAKSVLPGGRCCKDKVALPLFLAFHYHSLLAWLRAWSRNFIVDYRSC